LSVDPNGRALMLVGALARGLSHRLRTPLSIISNDLSYLRTLVPSGECDRALTRCREIAEILREISEGARLEGARQAFTIGALLEELRPETQISLELGGGGARQIEGDRAGLRRAFKLLAELLARFGAAGRGGVSIIAGGDEKTVRIRFVAEAPAGLKPGLPSEGYASLTELWSGALESDAWAPAVVDGVVWAHGGTIRAGVAESFSIQVELPAAV
jgi:hypothetical protein